MEEKKYYLGLDIGTSSVGFAVTDDQYHLIRKKGKHLWGSRLFNEASTAEARRMNRSSRRRYQRRRERINLLRDIFAPEIANIDSNFYKRLDYSSLHQEDKPITNLGMSLLEGNMSDSAFYKLYPTIYHLRYDLLTNKDKKFDIRLIYLAFSHMIKYRGNFLRDGDINQNSEGQEVDILFKELNGLLKETVDFENESFDFKDNVGVELLNTFRKFTKKAELLDKEKELLKPSNKRLEELLRLINGGTVKITKVFPELIEDNEELKDFKIEFDQEDYEGIILSSALPFEYQNLLLKAKAIHDLRVLTVLLGNASSLSEAMKNIYDEHKTDLLKLKMFYKKYAPDKYSAMFLDHDTNLNNYGAYVGRYFEKDSRKRKDLERKKDGQANFYKKVKEDLGFAELFDIRDISLLTAEQLVKKQDLLNIKNKIDDGTFLGIQNGRTNGVIPYQLNKNEMRVIIENQSKFYPFLKEKAKSFINPEKEEYKLISLLEYRIPYYVGPLGPAKESWMVRKKDGKIDPWNFHDLVDTSKTAEGFINRMKNSCSYLRNETTLPKYSLLNLEFQINNELNNVYLDNNTSLSYKDKQGLFEEVYKKNKTVTIEKIKTYLKQQYGNKVQLRPKKSDDEEKLKDILKTSFTSYYDFANEKGFGKDFDKKEELRKKAEDIIELITLFEDKAVLKKELKKKNLTDSQIDYFASLGYKGWSSFSRKLLINKSTNINGGALDILSLPTTDGGDKTSAVPETIFNLVKHTNKNFMQVINDPAYGFQQAILDYNKEEKLTPFEMIDEAYLSPAMKRAVRQTYKIIDELKRILKIDKFDRIFVECTREKEKDPKKKASRKDNLLKAYEDAAKQLVKEQNNLVYLKQCKGELQNNDNDRLQAKKLFLYFAQMGHSVYTGKAIDINDLENYDIDHIIPQALMKDDSFVNTVLVEKDINNKKQDAYPFANAFVTKEGKNWIEFLHRVMPEYMSSEKQNRILRISPLNDEEMEGFINRQLTTTNQSVKAVCSLLNATDPDTTIVYSKAKLVSDFRNIFGLLKIRSLNNFHHANDAYLNIVVGNVYYEKFNNLQTKKYIEEHKANDKDFKLFTDAKSIFTFYDHILSKSNNGVVIWNRTLTEEEKKKSFRDRDPRLVGGTIDLVRKTLSWNDVMVTHMLETIVGKQGFFNKIQIQRNKNNSLDNKSALCPLKLNKNSPYAKDNWNNKYGGYSDLTTPYYYLIESVTKKGEKQYSLEGIPTIYAKNITSVDDVEAYFNNSNNSKLLNPHFIGRDCNNTYKKFAILELPTEDNQYVRFGVTGRSGSSLICINLNELHMNLKWQDYYKSITKILGLNLPVGTKIDLSKYENCDDCIIEGAVRITKEDNSNFYKYLIDNIYSLNIYNEMPGSQSSKFGLEESYASFANLSVLKQIQLLHTMVILLNCASVQGKDISMLNQEFTKNAGIILVNKKLPIGARLIEQSTTGFYEKVLFEVKE